METIQKGFSEPSPGLTNGTTKAQSVAISVSVKELSDVESETKTTVASSQSSPISRAVPADALTVTTRPVSPLNGFTRVRKVTGDVVEYICKLPGYNPSFVKEMDLRSYLQFISDERLINMPRRGSDWDRVLSTAQFFGLQIWFFGAKIETFASGSQDAAAAALASCQVLLDVCCFLPILPGFFVST